MMTFKQEKGSKGYVFDIFNKDGVFIGRKCLNVCSHRELLGSLLFAQAKHNRLYKSLYEGGTLMGGRSSSLRRDVSIPFTCSMSF